MSDLELSLQQPGSGSGSDEKAAGSSDAAAELPAPELGSGADAAPTRFVTFSRKTAAIVGGVLFAATVVVMLFVYLFSESGYNGGKLGTALSLSAAAFSQAQPVEAATPSDMAVATAFFDACESGRGWAATAEYVSAGATFDVQAMDSIPGPAITDCHTVQDYAEWMKGVVKELGPQATFSINAAAFDEARSTAIFYATFGGFSDYVYSLSMESGKITHMTKIWNDAYAFKIISGPPPPAPPPAELPAADGGDMSPAELEQEGIESGEILP